MQLNFALLLSAGILAWNTPKAIAAEGDVLTATRVVHTLINQSPYFVDRTTEVVWTEGPSITESATATPTAADDTVVFGETAAAVA